MADDATQAQPTPDAQPARVFLRDKYGRRFSISEEKQAQALQQGFRPETADEAHAADVEKKYGGLGGELKAGAAGLARGATAGLSDVLLTKTGLAAPETLEGLKEANPASSIGGEVAGTVGSLLIPGLGEVSAPGLIGRAGASVAEHLGGTLAARAAGAAVEGGLFGLGNTLSESALGNTPVTAQKMVASVGLGALLGGAGMAGLSKAGEAAAPLFGKLSQALEGAPEVVGEAASGRALKAAGFSKATLKGLGTTETEMLEGGAALNDATLNNGTRLIERGDRPADVMAKVAVKSDELGESIGNALKQVDKSGAKFDMDAFVKRAREQLIAPLAEDPAHEAEANALAKLVDGYEANGTDSFAEANKLKSGLGKKIRKWDPTDPIQAERRKLYGLLNDEIESQVGDAGGEDLRQAFRQDKQLYGVMQAAERAGNASVRGELGNRFLSPSDHGIGMGSGVAAMMHGASGPVGVLTGLAAAGANKVAREYGPAFFARTLDDLAQAPWFHTAADAFSGFAKRLASDSPQALGKYAPILTSALGRGPEDALLTHAALSQTDPEYRQTMMANGLDYTQHPGDVATKAAALAALKAHLDGHDVQTQDAAADALHGKGTTDARLNRSPVLGDFSTGPTKSWQDRLQALNAMAQNPQALAERIAGQLGPLASVAPQLATAMSTTAAQAVQFLQSKAPQTQDPFASIPALARQWQPSETDKARFQRYLAAAEDPRSVLAQLAQGHVTREAVETLRTVYPDLYADMRAKVVQALSAHKTPLSTSQRVALSALMGQPMDATLRPERLAQLQAPYAPAQAPAPATHQAPTHNRELKPPKGALASEQSPAQRIENRAQGGGADS